MAEILTFGYTGTTPEAIRGYAERHKAIVVDVRFSPVSRHPRWTKKSLAEALPDRYVHLQGFGNANYKGGAVKLADPHGAYAILKANIIPHFNTLMLMCACEDVLHCHRRDVAFWLKEMTDWPITHIPKAEILVYQPKAEAVEKELTQRQIARLQRQDVEQNQLGLGMEIPAVAKRRYTDES